MATTTAIAIYFLIWWIVLFAVLPWGVRAQGEDGAGEAVPGTDPGAPGVPRLMAKLIWTTIVAGLVWSVCAFVYVKGLVTLDGLAAIFGFRR
jgi:predicted secreted protein